MLLYDSLVEGVADSTHCMITSGRHGPGSRVPRTGSLSPAVAVLADEGYREPGCFEDASRGESLPVLVEIPKRLRCRVHATAITFVFSVLPISV